MTSRRDIFAGGESCVGKVVTKPESDVVEREDGIYIFCNLPGVSEENVHLEIEDGTLHLHAASGFGQLPCGRVHALEFDDTVYDARMELGDRIEKNGISASLRNGVLHIILPFVHREGPRRIPVTQA
ncbi:Hsp20/alpha crystallin family protein [Desulfovibrio sp. OttesenSCG-928-I05]|nr:Hsp20/alpha crystallin family protein [Desulfovibrio sp. OttesenSCG-928-I05]